MRKAWGAVRWVVVAVLASFGAGVAVGLVAPAVAAAVARPTDPDRRARDVGYLVDRYGLDGEQARLIRLVLEACDAERVAILMQYQLQLPEQAQLELAAANQRAEERIKHVLTVEQRARFLRDSELAPAGGAARGGAESR